MTKNVCSLLYKMTHENVEDTRFTSDWTVLETNYLDHCIEGWLR